jgi:hypothetical protein
MMEYWNGIMEFWGDEYGATGFESGPNERAGL